MDKIKILIIGCLSIWISSGCKKFVAVPAPNTSILGSEIFSTNADAESAINGIYVSMAQNSFGGGLYGVSIPLGLSADEIELYPGSDSQLQQVYSNNQTSTNNVARLIWSNTYNIIYQANAAISGIPTSAGMTPSIKNQFLGEALFVRAYCYFYLVNIYGDVPLVTVINYQSNTGQSRTPQNLVYQQIITDLKQAEGLLSDSYLDGSGAASSERVRPNKEAVAALLSRVYLYRKDWANAEKQANEVIASGIYSLNADLNQAFLTTSTEAIWQLELPATTGFTPDGGAFLPGLLYGGPSGGQPVYLNNSLIMSFEHGDLRKASWVDSVSINGNTYYYPYKYKEFSIGPPSEYPMMLRYAEQYLILAEAYAHQNQGGYAISNLNVIRSRAGLNAYVGATDSTSILNVIMHEKRIEFFTENGHRWLDLKRSGSINTIMTPASTLKGGSWNANMQLYPIPQSDIQLDPQLKQNPGYR